MNERLKEIRKSLGLTQSEFAERISITRSGYASIESGVSPVQERHIKLIVASVHGLSERWLRTGEGPMYLQSSGVIEEVMQKYSFPDIVRKLLEEYEKLDDEKQAVVLDYVRGLVASIVNGNTIDEKVEAYRQELIDQEQEGSYPSQTTAEEEVI